MAPDRLNALRNTLAKTTFDLLAVADNDGSFYDRRGRSVCCMLVGYVVEEIDVS